MTEQNQQRKDALFAISNRTLAGTSEWHFQIKFSWSFALLFVLYGLYWMEMSNDRKLLALISFLFVCYAAVNLSGNVRSREEANKLQQYAEKTNLYGISNVKTLRGTDTKYWFHWIMFIVASIAMISAVWYVEMPSERRGYLTAAGVMMLTQTFVLTKTIKDQEDADKWWNDYNGREFKSE